MTPAEITAIIAGVTGGITTVMAGIYKIKALDLSLNGEPHEPNLRALITGHTKQLANHEERIAKIELTCPHLNGVPENGCG